MSCFPMRIIIVITTHKTLLLQKKNMNIEKRRILKIKNMDYNANSYESHLKVLSIAPCLNTNFNLEIKIAKWVLNWN